MRYVHYVPRLDAAAKLTASFGRYQAGTELSEPEVSEVALRNLSARISYLGGAGWPAL